MSSVLGTALGCFSILTALVLSQLVVREANRWAVALAAAVLGAAFCAMVIWAALGAAS